MIFKLIDKTVREISDTYVHSLFFTACIIDRKFRILEASWNAETKSSMSLNTITEFTRRTISTECRRRSEKYCFMSWLARSTIPSHAIYLEASPATFVNDSEFESSKGLPKLTIVGSYGLFIRQDYPGIRLVPFFTPPYPRRRPAATQPHAQRLVRSRVAYENRFVSEYSPSDTSK